MLIFFASHFAMAQVISVEQEIKKIDSLIEYNRFDIAQKKTDSLYQQLNTAPNRKKYKAQFLEIRYQQAVLFDRKDDSSPESLKILLDISDETEAENLHELYCKILLLTALAYEKAGDFFLENEHLNKAYKIYKESKLDNIYSTYCIRRSSYYRITGKLDSSFHYARQAKVYAEKYHNEQDIVDAHTLLKADLVHNTKEELEYYCFLLKCFQKLNNHTSISMTYNGIARIYYQNIHNFSKALSYSDSAYAYYKAMPLMYKNKLPNNRSNIFEAIGKVDSAFYYFKQYHNDVQLLQKQEGAINTKKLEKQYQNDKKEATIKNKNQQLILIIVLLMVITIASILLARYSRKINWQNKVITKQLKELNKTLEQKQILLSELQHRVKNNLQHVISILEIQKESVDFNNLNELIRSNQNRIHSMALLHKKLNIEENVNEVNLKRYIIELSELVKDSYDNQKKKIVLKVQCEVKKISIEKALPIGFIIVELISNSIKHAFKKRSIGIITIEISKDEILNKNKLYYADNGYGFDFNKTSQKGLGQEIIKGLIDQLNGTFKAESKSGFELSVLFD